MFDGAPHFFKEHELSKFRPPNYKPDFNDVLYCRRKTTGVVEARVTFPDLRLLFIDVGGMHLNILTVSGQRSERKKWVNLFGGLEGLIFVVSLSEFDQLCYEDEQTNRMQESLDLFDETINNSSFAQLPVIVFFNVCELAFNTNALETGFICRKVENKRHKDCLPRLSRRSNSRSLFRIYQTKIPSEKQTRSQSCSMHVHIGN